MIRFRIAKSSENKISTMSQSFPIQCPLSSWLVQKLLCAVFVFRLATIVMATGGGSLSDMFCHEANATCFLKEECRVRMTLLQSTCGPYGKFCTLPQPSKNDPPGQSYVEYCRSALSSIKQSEPSLRCICSVTLTSDEYLKCNAMWNFLERHPCVENPRWSTSKTKISDSHFASVTTIPSTTTTESLSINGQLLHSVQSTQKPGYTFANIIEYDTIKSSSGVLFVDDTKLNSDCLKVKRQCDESTDCKQARRYFRQKCNGNDLECDLKRTSCLAAYEDVRHFGLFSCTCGEGSYIGSDCLKHQRIYQKNSCLVFYESQFTSNGVNNNAIQQKQEPPQSQMNNLTKLNNVVGSTTTTRHFQPPNCLEVYRQCARSSTCLQLMMRLAEDCRWNHANNVCLNYTLCQKALSNFYSVRKEDDDDTIGNAAERCQCANNDAACGRQKYIFRPRCALKHRITKSCLQLYATCEMDVEGCFSKLNHYRRICDVDAQSNRCIHSPAECQRRRHIIWGTVLTLNCTCDHHESDDVQLATKGFQNTCLEIMRLFKNPPCLGETKLMDSMDQSKMIKRKSELEIIQNACMIIKNNYNENEVRLYHNATCSQLCICSEDNNFANHCRQLTCESPFNKCQWSHNQLSTQEDCQCIRNKMYCFSNGNELNQKPGLYLSVIYSASEHTSVEEHAAKRVSVEKLAITLTRLIRNISERRLCRFSLAWQNTERGYAIFQIHQRGQFVTSTCDSQMRLAQMLLENGYPEIVHHPYLSVIKGARIIQVGNVQDMPLASTKVVAGSLNGADKSPHAWQAKEHVENSNDVTVADENIPSLANHLVLIQTRLIMMMLTTTILLLMQ